LFVYYLVANIFSTSCYPVVIPSIIDSGYPAIGYQINSRGTSLLNASRNLLKKQKQRFDKQEEEAITKILRLYKQKHLLKKHETKITRRNLKYLNKLIVIKKKKEKGT
jgi:hypothetical protein